jgi:hypothetical protein
MNQITKVGFYNPQKPDSPLDALTAALEDRRRELSGSLLALPEAFNIGTDYSRRGEIQKDPRILSDLQRLCADFDICIVAGLIITGPADRGNRPYSSAHLIDAFGAGLLCHKMLSDSQGPYMTCLDGCDGHNAIEYRNIALCSLICMDSYEANDPERHERLKTKMQEVTNIQHRIVCVPAYIDKPLPELWGIPNSYRVVANSASRTEFPESPGSFIERIDERGNPCRLVELEEGDEPTCIKLYPLTAPGS